MPQHLPPPQALAEPTDGHSKKSEQRSPAAVLHDLHWPLLWVIEKPRLEQMLLQSRIIDPERREYPDGQAEPDRLHQSPCTGTPGNAESTTAAATANSASDCVLMILSGRRRWCGGGVGEKERKRKQSFLSARVS